MDSIRLIESALFAMIRRNHPHGNYPSRGAGFAELLDRTQEAAAPDRSPIRSVPRSIPALANEAARKHGIPEGLFRRLIWVESEFNPRAVSPKGAMGLGQLMPATAKELGLNLDPQGGKGSVWNPESNLDASARYLRWLHDAFRRKGVDEESLWQYAAGAYNAGIGNISRAVEVTPEGFGSDWETIASVLPRITGTASKETIRYIEKLRI